MAPPASSETRTALARRVRLTSSYARTDMVVVAGDAGHRRGGVNGDDGHRHRSRADRLWCLEFVFRFQGDHPCHRARPTALEQPALLAVSTPYPLVPGRVFLPRRAGIYGGTLVFHMLSELALRRLFGVSLLGFAASECFPLHQVRPTPHTAGLPLGGSPAFPNGPSQDSCTGKPLRRNLPPSYVTCPGRALPRCAAARLPRHAGAAAIAASKRRPTVP